LGILLGLEACRIGGILVLLRPLVCRRRWRLLLVLLLGRLLRLLPWLAALVDLVGEVLPALTAASDADGEAEDEGRQDGEHEQQSSACVSSIGHLEAITAVVVGPGEAHNGPDELPNEAEDVDGHEGVVHEEVPRLGTHAAHWRPILADAVQFDGHHEEYRERYVDHGQKERDDQVNQQRRVAAAALDGAKDSHDEGWDGEAAREEEEDRGRPVRSAADVREAVATRVARLAAASAHLIAALPEILAAPLARVTQEGRH